MVTKTKYDSKWNTKIWANHNFLIKLPRTFLHLSTQKEARGVSIKVTLKPIKMEYEIDFKLKYTTLQIITMVDWKKKMNEKQKKTRTQIPLGGMGHGLERAYSKLFLLPKVTISENWYDASWFLYRMKPRAYKVQKLKISVKKGDPWGDSEGPKVTLEQKLLLFFVIPDKKNQDY